MFSNSLLPMIKANSDDVQFINYTTSCFLLETFLAVAADAYKSKNELIFFIPFYIPQVVSLFETFLEIATNALSAYTTSLPFF